MTTALEVPSQSVKSRDLPGWRSVCLIMFAVAWGGNQFTPLLSMYRVESAFSEVTVNMLLFAYVVGLVPSLLLSAAAARRFSARSLLTAAVVMSALGSILLLIGAASPLLMFFGRSLIGLALGIGMVVGGLVLKALAVPLNQEGDGEGKTAGPSAARSSAMALTAGFGLGAGLAGIVAQWLPHPTLSPYFLHLFVCLLAGISVFRLRLPHVGGDEEMSGTVRVGFRMEFFLQVLPAAPWIFGALGIAYAILPSVAASQLEGFSTAFSALLCLLSLGFGFAAQQVVGVIASWWRVPARPIGIALFIVGTIIAITVTSNQSLALIVCASMVLGVGYGLILVGCLQDCDQLAHPGQLGMMTGIVYTLGYLGFGLPMVVAWLHENFEVSYSLMLCWIAGFALLLNLTGSVSVNLLRRYRRVDIPG